MTIHLRSIALKDSDQLPDQFPFNVPVIRSLQELNFSTEVTFFVGENGSGKSTLLEAIAAGANLPAIGSTTVDQDETLFAARALGQALKWVWNKRVRVGFFMRSEDFFGFARRTAQEMAELRRDYEADDGHKGQSLFARRLQKMPFAGEIHALRNLYGDGLDAQSHGESFFKLFRSRFRAGGLYLLDEPEAPLSPSRQLTLIALLHSMVQQDAQFIIATHSPLLLAYPGATIYNFAEGQIQQTPYEELEHVTLTRDFLNNPALYLRHLLDEA
jgi:predicted ATPase